MRFALAFCALLSINLAYAQSSATSDMDLSAWAAYAKNLATCTPGTFTLPNFLSKKYPITYTIKGLSEGKCMIKITQPVDTITFVTDCALPKDSLPAMSQSAEQIAQHNLAGLSESISKVMSGSCKAVPGT